MMVVMLVEQLLDGELPFDSYAGRRFYLEFILGPIGWEVYWSNEWVQKRLNLDLTFFGSD